MDKLKKLRALMRERGLDAYIIPSADAHNSEYVCDYWRGREWVSGFTGSAGLVVVTPTEAGLWTDGRYFIQAAQELPESITLYKMGQPGIPTYEEFLRGKKTAKIGFDGRTMTVSAFEGIKEKLPNAEYSYIEDLVGMIWQDRPVLPTAPAFEHPPEFAGLSAAQKLEDVRVKMKVAGVDTYLVTALDDIAWLLNIRGRDVAATPLVYAFVLITEKDAHVFTDRNKFTDLAGKLTCQGFTMHDYDAVPDMLKSLSASGKIYYNKEKTNTLLAESISQELQDTNDIIAYMKGAKTAVELSNTRNAYIKEGVVLVKMLKWLNENVDKGLTEDDVDKKITALRKEQEYYLHDGFNTIAAYMANGALSHYRHTGAGDSIKPEGFLLIDTGGQYMDGTTDTTRTIAVGALTDEMIRDFTLVLKAHIAFSLAVFPTGTTGHQLDMVARQPILQSLQNYNHGTGHGIGYCLGVHEGPHRISPHPVQVALVPGMLASNEPALYKEGRYGIRTENIVAVKELCKNEFGEFLAFETLTLCPYDMRAVDLDMLTQQEKEFVNAYHARVFETLAPLLSVDEQAWLANATYKI